MLDDLKREIAQTPGLKESMAKWAIGGAVAGIILPGLGSIVGAVGGAGFAYYKAKKRS